MIGIKLARDWRWTITDRHGYQNHYLVSIHLVPDFRSKSRAVVLILGPIMTWVAWNP